MSSRAAPIVDADGHVCEPTDLWEKGLPAKDRARALRLRWNVETGYDEAWVEDWCITDRGLVGLGNAGTPFVTLGKGRRYVDGHRGGFDPHCRVDVLDAEGIDVAVLYGGLALSLPAIHDPALAAAHCRIYNDWIAAFCRAAPNRLHAAAAIPLQDPEAAAAEARRARSLGLCAAFTRPNALNPARRPLHDLAHERVWSELEHLDMPLALHPAGLWDMPGASRAMASLMAPGTHHALILFFDQYMTLANLVYGGVLERHPRLRIVVLECGGGWIAHWMDRLDEFTESYGWQLLGLKRKPSEYVRDQVVVSYDPGEHTMAALSPQLGDDMAVWASDFPHSDAKYPGVVAELREHTADLPAEARAKLHGRNALRFYGIPEVS